MSKKITWILFILYVILLVNLTLFNSNYGRESCVESINLIPFKTIIEYLNEFPSKFFIINILGNLLAFTPFAFFLPRLFSKINSSFKIIITTTLIVFTIELLQFITKSGAFDIDDLILNVLGTFLAYMLLKTIKK